MTVEDKTSSRSSFPLHSVCVSLSLTHTHTHTHTLSLSLSLSLSHTHTHTHTHRDSICAVDLHVTKKEKNCRKSFYGACHFATSPAAPKHDDNNSRFPSSARSELHLLPWSSGWHCNEAAHGGCVCACMYVCTSPSPAVSLPHSPTLSSDLFTHTHTHTSSNPHSCHPLTELQDHSPLRPHAQRQATKFVHPCVHLCVRVCVCVCVCVYYGKRKKKCKNREKMKRKRNRKKEEKLNK